MPNATGIGPELVQIHLVQLRLARLSLLAHQLQTVQDNLILFKTWILHSVPNLTSDRQGTESRRQTKPCCKS